MGQDHIFVSNNEYGFDVYLSVGIRHGTLAGQLRSALDKTEVLSQRNNDGEYISNEIWIPQLEAEGILDVSEVQVVNTQLVEFSRAIDATITTLRNDWIQIKTEERANQGLFDFSISDSDVFMLNRRIAKNCTLEEAIDTTIDLLWQKTDKNLGTIRYLLSYEVKQKFTSTVDLCLKGTDVNENSEVLRRLRSALATSRTNIQSEVDNIAAWFTRQEKNATKPFSIQLAADIALAMVERCYPQRKLLLTKKGEGNTRLNGDVLKGIVNILYFAFDNILHHCGSHRDNPWADIEYKASAERLTLVLRSQVFKRVDVSAENAWLGDLLAEIEAPGGSDRVRQEGRTGFIKIAKTARVDFGCSLKMKFGYESKDVFRVTLDLAGGRIFV